MNEGVLASAIDVNFSSPAQRRGDARGRLSGRAFCFEDVAVGVRMRQSREAIRVTPSAIGPVEASKKQEKVRLWREAARTERRRVSLEMSELSDALGDDVGGGRRV